MNETQGMATARELLLDVLRNTATDYLDARFPGFDEAAFADYLLTTRDGETLNRAADTYERREADRYPGVIYGAIRRTRAYRVGAFLRSMAGTTDDDQEQTEEKG